MLLVWKHFQIGGFNWWPVRRRTGSHSGCSLESRLPIRTRCICASQALIMSIALFVSLSLCQPESSTSSHLTASLISLPHSFVVLVCFSLFICSCISYETIHMISFSLSYKHFLFFFLLESFIQHKNVYDVLLINCKDMNDKKNILISHFYQHSWCQVLWSSSSKDWRPVERPQRSILTVSYKKKLPWKKKCQPHYLFF